MFAPSISSWVFVTYMLREIHSRRECSNMRKIFSFFFSFFLSFCSCWGAPYIQDFMVRTRNRAPQHMNFHPKLLILRESIMNFDYQMLGGLSDGVFWWFPALSEDQEKKWLNLPELSCGFKHDVHFVHNTKWKTVQLSVQSYAELLGDFICNFRK